jgi:hypothetical protein
VKGDAPDALTEALPELLTLHFMLETDAVIFNSDVLNT